VNIGQLAYPMCGTKTGNKVGLPVSKANEVFENTVHLIELVHPGGILSGPREEAVYLTSLTVIDVKCCRSSDTPAEQVCTEDEVPEPALFLEACNEKQFELNCGVDAVNERFHCELNLKAGETLGTNQMGFYVDSCTAETQEQCDIPLISGATNFNADLEVTGRITGRGDNTKYIFESAYFQQSANGMVAQEVKISCTVKLALTAALPVWSTMAVDSKVLSSSPWIQAGKINLVK